MTNYIGDYAPSSTVVFAFTTVNSSGVPTVLSGSPQAAIYKGTTSSALTAGVTLTLSYVSALTGANLVKIDTSQDTTNYTPGNDYTVALASGLVGTTSVSGYTIGHFSLTNRGPANNVSGISQTNVVQIAGTVAVSSLALGNTNVVQIAQTGTVSSLALGNTNVVQIAQTGTVSSLALGNTNLVTWVGSGPNALQSGLVQVAVLSGTASVVGTINANVTQINGVAATSSGAQLGVNVTQWRDITPNVLQNGLVQAAIVSGGAAGSSNITQINGVAVQAASGFMQVNVSQWEGVAPAPLTATLLVQTAQSGNIAGSVNSVVTRVTANSDQIAGAATVSSLALGNVNVTNWQGSGPNALQNGLVQTAIVSGAASGVVATVTANMTQISGATVATSSAQLGVNVVTFAGNPTGVTNIDRSTRSIALGTVSNTSTTTQINLSTITPSMTTGSQFVGRIVNFDQNTTTANLRGQSTNITAGATSGGGNLTVTALTDAPALNDTFTIT